MVEGGRCVHGTGIWLDNSIPVSVSLGSRITTAALVPACGSSAAIAAIVVVPHKSLACRIVITPFLGRNTGHALLVPQLN